MNHAKLESGFKTDVGRVRHANEDSLLLDEQLGLFIVTDGLGGHRAGEVASRQVKRAGRIPGAKNVDWEWNLTTVEGVKVLKGADELAKLYEGAGATKDKEIIVYCRTGMRSSHAYLALRLLGYPKVRNYDASMIEWGNRPELPIEKQ